MWSLVPPAAQALLGHPVLIALDPVKLGAHQAHRVRSAFVLPVVAHVLFGDLHLEKLDVLAHLGQYPKASDELRRQDEDDCERDFFIKVPAVDVEVLSGIGHDPYAV